MIARGKKIDELHGAMHAEYLYDLNEIVIENSLAKPMMACIHAGRIVSYVASHVDNAALEASGAFALFVNEKLTPLLNEAEVLLQPGTYVVQDNNNLIRAVAY